MTDLADHPHTLVAEDELRCPLCEYDLRGQVDPRCPECGYRFTWEELRDRSLRIHPYLYEHHPERRFRSFWRTLFGGLRPRRFWRTLYPTQPSSPKRLVAYWLLAATPLVLALLAVQVIHLRETSKLMQAERMRLLLSSWPPILVQQIERNYGSVERYIDLSYPPPRSLRFLRAAYGNGFGPVTWTVLMWLVWPWLTFLAMLVFRISMRRARVLPVHVLRCILYSFDGVFWVGVLFAAAVLTGVLLPAWSAQAPEIRWPDLLEFILPPLSGPGAAAVFIGGALAMPVMTYRLVVAFRRYLQFDRPVATVLATQVIVLLTMLIVSSSRIRLR